MSPCTQQSPAWQSRGHLEQCGTYSSTWHTVWHIEKIINVARIEQVFVVTFLSQRR